MPASIPRSTALLLAPLGWLAAGLAHGVLPWAISTLARHHGWAAGSPGVWNRAGFLPVGFGTLLLLWVFATGRKQYQQLPERISLDWAPKLLLVDGPYRWSRNPMYAAELALWLGWTILFGSVLLLAMCAVLWVGMSVIIRREERDLAAHQPGAYRAYRATVPRWL